MSKIKLSPTAEDALKLKPNTLEFTSVGIGTLIDSLLEIKILKYY